MSIRQSSQDTANTWLNTPLNRYGLAAIVLTAVVGGVYLNHSEPLVAPHVAEPIIQGQQLRYPANHPQLKLLITTPARAATSVTVELPARLTWNEERTQRIYPAFAGRVQQLMVDLGQSVVPG